MRRASRIAEVTRKLPRLTKHMMRQGIAPANSRSRRISVEEEGVVCDQAVAGMSTDVREEQLAKAYWPIDVTDDGMVTEVREEQLKKALLLISVTDDGMSTDARERQLAKACSLIDVTMTDGYRVTRRYWKARAPISVTPSATVA